jgi:hypothetical protein
VLALVVVEAVAIVLLGVLVAGLLRSHAEILRRLHELGAGLDEESPRALGAVSPLPMPTVGQGAYDVAGVTPHDEAVAVSVTGVAHDTVIAFLTSGCSTCEQLFRERPTLPSNTRLVMVVKDEADESLSEVRRLAPTDVPVVMSSQAWVDYGVPGSPYFVHVDGPSGSVRGEGAAQSWRQVSGLIAQALADAKAGGEREARADAELLAAGIKPGHESLYG